jgi:hypothetical protein
VRIRRPLARWWREPDGGGGASVRRDPGGDRGGDRRFTDVDLAVVGGGGRRGPDSVEAVEEWARGWERNDSSQD